MAGNILTPSAIWKGFSISSTPSAEVIDVKKDGAVSFTRLYIDGKDTSDGKVRIFGVLAKPVAFTKGPAVLLLQDFEKTFDDKFIKTLASQGYCVLAIDLYGKQERKEYFTEYPASIDYANYANVKQNIYAVEGDATATCWYQWACATRYALKYLKDQPFVTCVGSLCYGQSATAMWQVVGSEDDLKCSAFVLNAGWIGYRGIYKFSGKGEPQFTDEMYKFIAGIDPQAYAMHVNCPALVLSATGSNDFDCDRAWDTLSRMENSPFKTLHYSVGDRVSVNDQAYKNLELFFNKFLLVGGADKDKLPSEVDISAELVDGKFVVTVKPEDGAVKSVDLYASEEIYLPAERCWQKICGKKPNENGEYIYEYSAYPNSGAVTFFAQVTYKNGFSIGSKIINKKYSAEEVCFKNKSKILYSSRYACAESIFAVGDDGQTMPIAVSDKAGVKTKKGPMGIEGVCCENGLLTFKFKGVKDAPNDDAMLMFDVYLKEEGQFVVKLIADYFGSKTEYFAVFKGVGGDVWHNVKFERNKFKTAEGMTLKDYTKINAVAFSALGKEFLINNALWV